MAVTGTSAPVTCLHVALASNSVNLADSPLKRDALREFDSRLEILERTMRTQPCGFPRQRYASRTIGVLPFYGVGAGSGHSIRQTKLR